MSFSLSERIGLRYVFLSWTLPFPCDSDSQFVGCGPWGSHIVVEKVWEIHVNQQNNVMNTHTE